MSRTVLLVSTLALMACGPVYKYTLTAETPAAAKPPLCNFRVANVPPEKGYVEIGTLDYHVGAVANAMDGFKLKVQAEVCQAGGDLVVPQINGYGYYVRGIVFAKAPEQTAAAQ